MWGKLRLRWLSEITTSYRAMNAPVVIENQNCYANCFRMKQNIWCGNEKIIFSDKYEHSRPLSDSAINLAAYLLGWLEFGDTTLAMALSHGDRLAHGVTVSHVGERFNVVYLYLMSASCRVCYTGVGVSNGN